MARAVAPAQAALRFVGGRRHALCTLRLQPRPVPGLQLDSDTSKPHQPQRAVCVQTAACERKRGVCGGWGGGGEGFDADSRSGSMDSDHRPGTLLCAEVYVFSSDAGFCKPQHVTEAIDLGSMQLLQLSVAMP